MLFGGKSQKTKSCVKPGCAPHTCVDMWPRDAHHCPPGGLGGARGASPAQLGDWVAWGVLLCLSFLVMPRPSAGGRLNQTLL